MSKNKESVPSLEMKNLYVNFLYKALDVPLHGEQRRARTSFAEKLRKRLQEIEEERIEIVKKFAEKDAKGEPKVKEDQNYDISDDNMKKFSEEYRAFLDETWVIDVLPSNKQELKTVRDILQNSTQKYGTAEGEIFDKLLDEFQKL